ncbi:MAG: hydrolase [Alphaproteobacteria bacterium]|nr:MAG: hydrolase [Alphaproteobacteria bacterium]
MKVGQAAISDFKGPCMTIKTLFATAALALSALCATGVLADDKTAETPAKPTTLYTGVKLIDGTGAQMQDGMAILVAGDRILKIAPAGELQASLPEGTKLVDGSGWYALPGLIDTHVHMATVPNEVKAEALMRRYVYSGVTTVRDMAGDMRALADLARKSRLGKIPAPDLYYAALMAGPTFFHDPRPGAAAEGEVPGQVPWMQAITPDTDMVKAVAMARGTWATGIKIYANLPSAEVHRISTEAHKQGIKVWAHSMVFPATPGDVVDARVDVISHVCRLAFEISDEKPTQYHHTIQPPYDSLDPRDPRLAALFAKMKAQGTILDATLWLYTHIAERQKGQKERKAGPAICPPAFAGALTQFAYEQGVNISAGTDSNLPAEAAYPSLFDEMTVLATDAKMPPLQVIRSATLVGARTMGLEADRGSLEAGKKADILFLDQNPLTDIANLRSVVLTVKSGREYARADYVPLSKDELAGD